MKNACKKDNTKAALRIVRVKTGNLMEKETEVLIVEDSEEVLWMMGNVLEHAGFAVDGVTTGEGALKKVREIPEIRLIILNHLLPDMSGITVLNRLRKSGSRVKVIAVSAMKGVSESLMKAGAFTFFCKNHLILASLSACASRR